MVVEDRRVIAADPFRCRMWQQHGRLAGYVVEESCKDEMASFLEQGQLIPVLGRRLEGDPRFDFELIYGSRRLFVAQRLNTPLLVELRNLSDRDAAIALDIENRQRKELSPYERGLCYARWLRAGYFSSQEDIGETLRVSKSQVSRLLKLAHLPSVVVGAFASGRDICERWGLELSSAMQEPERRKLIIQRARAIGASTLRQPAGDIYRELLAPARRRGRRRATRRDGVVRRDNGKPLLRIRRYGDSIALILPIELVSSETQRDIERVVSRILNDSASDLPSLNGHASTRHRQLQRGVQPLLRCQAAQPRPRQENRHDGHDQQHGEHGLVNRHCL